MDDSFRCCFTPNRKTTTTTTARTTTATTAATTTSSSTTAMLYNDVFMQRKVISFIALRLPPAEVYQPTPGTGRLESILRQAKEQIAPFASTRVLRKWWNNFLLYGDSRAVIRRRHTQRRRGRYTSRSNRGTWNHNRNRVLQSIVDTEPQLYLDEIQDRFLMKTGERWSTSHLYRMLKSPAINYSLQAATDRATQQEQQQIDDYFEDMRYFVGDPEMLIFIDESAKDRNSSRRRRSWSRRGQTPFRAAYFAGTRAKRYTLLAACDIHGFVIEACETVERELGKDDKNPTRGTIDGDRFKLWVEEMLIPVLGKYHECAPRSIVVLDNASIHHVDGIVEMIEAAGAKVIFTAPYSPEYNPIETMFHLYKTTLRRHWQKHWIHAHCLGLESVTPQIARSLFRHAKVPGCEHYVSPQEKDEEEMMTTVFAMAVWMNRST
jgi:transposase